MADLNAPPHIAGLLGKDVTVRGNGGVGYWAGRLVAYAPDPSVIIDMEHGGRVCLPASYVIEPFPDAPEAERSIPPEERYRNALLWIRTVAGMHYFGGAFDPEHMRVLANLAANALCGKDLPDCEEVGRAAMARAREQAAKWSAMFDDIPGASDDEDAL